MLSSKYIKKVIAKCGHEGIAIIPPHSMTKGPGQIGLNNIKKAQTNPCYDRQDKAAKPSESRKRKITFIFQGE